MPGGGCIISSIGKPCCWTSTSTSRSSSFPSRNCCRSFSRVRRTVHLHEARRILIDEELKKLIDMDDVVSEALDRVENHGVIFIDEIDKIAGERGSVGPDVSREGVQRD